MNIVYCTSCGHKIEYTSPSPKFCPSCGSSMGNSSASVASSASVENTIVEEKIPSISKLEYEIDASNGNRVISGSDIQNISESPKRKISNSQGGNEDLIKEGMQLCRQSKKQTDIDG